MGDGYLLEGKIALSTTSEHLAKKYQKLIEKCETICRVYKRKQRRENWKPEIIVVASKKFTEKITQVIDELDKLLEKPKFARAFLRGMFDAEGTINFKSTRRGREIKISNTNLSLIKLICKALRCLHINFSVKASTRKGRKKCYNIKLYGKNSLKFIEKVKPFKLMDNIYLSGKINERYILLVSSLLRRT